MEENIAPVEPAVPAAPAPPAQESVAPVVAPEIKPDAVAPVEPAKPTETPKTGSEWTPVTEDITIPGVKYGEYNVDVKIPIEIANMAGEKGVDIEAVSNELYASEDFNLSEETLTGLYEAFGKFQVDTYLSHIKSSNDSMINSHKGEVETRSKNEEAAWNATMEVMGGEDRWEDLSAYASAKLDAEEIEEFNEVMDKGSLRMQQLMIKDLYGKFAAEGAPVAPVILDLEEGETGGDPGKVQSALTSDAYLDLIKTGEYKKDPAKYDALRRAGMKRGI